MVQPYSRSSVIIKRTSQRRERVLLSPLEKAVVVCRWGGGEMIAHAHRATQGRIPISQTFTARAFEYVGRF